MSEETFDDVFKDGDPGFAVAQPCDDVVIEVELFKIYGAKRDGGPVEVPDIVVKVKNAGKVLIKRFSGYARNEAKEFALALYKALRNQAASEVVKAILSKFFDM